MSVSSTELGKIKEAIRELLRGLQHLRVDLGVGDENPTHEYFARMLRCVVAETVQEQPAEGSKKTRLIPDITTYLEGGKIHGRFEIKLPKDDLDQLQSTRQIIRYRESFNNFGFTNGTHFKLYRSGVEVCSVQLCEWLPNEDRFSRPTESSVEAVAKLILQFRNANPEVPVDIKSLTDTMADLSRKSRARIKEDVNEGLEGRALLLPAERGTLKGILVAFRQFLVRDPHADVDAFARDTSQLMAMWSLIKADRKKRGKGTAPGDLDTLSRPFFLLQSTVDREAFLEYLEPFRDVCERLDFEVFREIEYHTFYQNYLHQFDPERAKGSGSYYTDPRIVLFVIAFIRRELDTINRKFTSPDVRFIDPATGTMPFPFACMEEMYREKMVEGGQGAWDQYVMETDFSKKIFMCEIQRVPAALAQYQILQFFQDRGPVPASKKMPKIFVGDAVQDWEMRVDMTLPIDDQEETRKAKTEREKELANQGDGWVLEAEKKKGEFYESPPGMYTVWMGNPPFGEKYDESIMHPHLRDLLHLGAALSTSTKKRQNLYNVFLLLPLLQRNRYKKLGFSGGKLTGVTSDPARNLFCFVIQSNFLRGSAWEAFRRIISAFYNRILAVDLRGDTDLDQTPEELVEVLGRDENLFNISQGVSLLAGVGLAPLPRELPNAHHIDLLGRKETKRLRLSLLSSDQFWSIFTGGRVDDPHLSHTVEKVFQVSEDRRHSFTPPAFEDEMAAELTEAYRRDFRPFVVGPGKVFTQAQLGVHTGHKSLLQGPSKQVVFDRLRSVQEGRTTEGDYPRGRQKGRWEHDVMVDADPEKEEDSDWEPLVPGAPNLAPKKKKKEKRASWPVFYTELQASSERMLWERITVLQEDPWDIQACYDLRTPSIINRPVYDKIPRCPEVIPAIAFLKQPDKGTRFDPQMRLHIGAAKPQGTKNGVYYTPLVIRLGKTRGKVGSAEVKKGDPIINMSVDYIQAQANELGVEANTDTPYVRTWDEIREAEDPRNFFPIDYPGPVKDALTASHAFFLLFGILIDPMYERFFSNLHTTDFPRIPVFGRSQREFVNHLIREGYWRARLEMAGILKPSQIKMIQGFGRSEVEFPYHGPKSVVIRGEFTSKGAGSEVEKGRVYFNRKEGAYFSNVPTSVWGLKTASTYPVRGWVRNRQSGPTAPEMVLGEDDIKYFQHLLTFSKLLLEHRKNLWKDREMSRDAYLSFLPKRYQ